MKEQYKADTIKYLWSAMVGEENYPLLRLDENGWANWRCKKFTPKAYWDSLSSKMKSNSTGVINGDSLFYRPKSLNGIEDNNGWHRIETTEDLPKIPDTYLFIVDGRQVQQWCEDGLSFSKLHTHWREMPIIRMPLW